jgi:uncharacterized protein YdbL (DUF1318 family)
MKGTDMLRKTMTVLALGAMLAVGGVAQAQVSPAKAAVDAAKAQGTVGEQADGYLGIVSGGDAALRAAVAEINMGRAAVYKDTAAKTGVTPEVAGQAVAMKLYAKLLPGQYWKPLGGGWMQK